MLSKKLIILANYGILKYLKYLKSKKKKKKEMKFLRIIFWYNMITYKTNSRLMLEQPKHFLIVSLS